MLLLAISPILVLIPVGVVAGVTGVILWARRKYMEMPELETELEDAVEEGVDGDAGAPKAAKKCRRTNMAFDARRWHSPPPVVAAFQKLGYPITSLTSSSGREEVMKFQATAIDRNLMGMAGASAEWVDGKTGPCTLISLSVAMNMLEAGNWPGA
jgi:hypothetical protein